MSDYILRLIQKRTINPNCEITQEEIIKAGNQLANKLLYLQLKIEILADRQKLLEKIIKKERIIR